MTMTMAVVASLLLVSVQTVSAQYNPRFPKEYFQSWDTVPAEDDLADAKARREKARKERELTGKSDLGARRRLEGECARSLFAGVEDDVRRSYGCGD